MNYLTIEQVQEQLTNLEFLHLKFVKVETTYRFSDTAHAHAEMVNVDELPNICGTGSIGLWGNHTWIISNGQSLTLFSMMEEHNVNTAGSFMNSINCDELTEMFGRLISGNLKEIMNEHD